MAETSMNKKKNKNVRSAKPVMIGIANQHTGEIMIPKAKSSSVSLHRGSLRFPPGEIVCVDKAEWDEAMKCSTVRLYVDAKILVPQRKKSGVCPVMSNTTADLPIPEHLMREEELVGERTAKVTKEKVGQITI